MLLRPFLFSRRHRATALFHSSQRINASKLFRLSDIGEGITECEIVKWIVKPQATVQEFDPLCEVQSDKASVEITSPYDGVVKELLVQEGQMAKVGSGLCFIETKEDGEGEVEDDNHTESEKPQRRLHPLDPNNTNVNLNEGVVQNSAVVVSDLTSSVFAAPSVRHFARQNGIRDLVLLAPGSGKDGRIVKSDVEAYLSQGTTTSPSESTISTTTTDDSSVPAQSQSDQDVIVQLGRTRYGMWKAMVKSLEIPHFGYSTTLDITDLHRILPMLNKHIPTHYLHPSSPPQRPPSWTLAVNPSALYPAPTVPPLAESYQYTRLTFLPFLLKTLSKAMLQWPLFRSSITPSNDAKPTLTIRPNADINIALSTPTGLYTPTLTNVNDHSVYDLASQLSHLSWLGRQTPSGLTMKQMPKRGGTITVSNVGAIGKGEVAAPVLVPGGGVAIVAVGRAGWVWDVDRSVSGERRLKVGVSWSGDHRIVEGAELAAFVEYWRGYVEAPERLVAEGL